MRKTDLQRLKEGLAQIYGEDNLLSGIEVGGLIYDVMVREPLMLVEYWGIQHFNDLSTLRANYNFMEIEAEDKRKKEHCAKHNIPLIIFTSSEKNFLTPQYIKYRIEYQLGTYGWFGEKEFI
jgi:hypothetical protein